MNACGIARQTGRDTGALTDCGHRGLPAFGLQDDHEIKPAQWIYAARYAYCQEMIRRGDKRNGYLPTIASEHQCEG